MISKPSRKSMRLNNYDYSDPGSYFITICKRETAPAVCKIVDGITRLNGLGRVVTETWESLDRRFPEIDLDMFVVMPNHIHGILQINPPNVGAIHELPLPETGSHTHKEIGLQRRRMLLSLAIGFFKMNSGKRINEIISSPGQPFWQRNYFDHIIRNEESLHRLRRYIIDNPQRWKFAHE
jgi:REP element-mobilizing transposase RayT